MRSLGWIFFFLFVFFASLLFCSASSYGEIPFAGAVVFTLEIFALTLGIYFVGLFFKKVGNVIFKGEEN
ncbi:MAG: hypothetical protein IAF38_03700 [Bacteroidia bacterium]|nr:hypothetical protein [Bacteroidia bacterium]